MLPDHVAAFLVNPWPYHLQVMTKTKQRRESLTKARRKYARTTDYKRKR